MTDHFLEMTEQILATHTIDRTPEKNYFPPWVWVCACVRACVRVCVRVCVCMCGYHCKVNVHCVCMHVFFLFLEAFSILFHLSHTF